MLAGSVVATAEVRVADDHDRLLVHAAEPEQVGALRAALRAATVPHRRVAAGAQVAAVDAPTLAAAALEVPLRWGALAERYAANRRGLADRHRALRAAVSETVHGGAAVAREALADLPGAERLDDHQALNVAALTRPECFGLCVFDEQGTGKTVTALFTAHQLFQRDSLDHVLVVAPKSMVAEWPRDLDRFCDGLYSSAVLTGPAGMRRAVLADPPDLVVCNFEAVLSLGERLASLARRYDGRSLLVVDESFMVKNLDAQRTRALRRLREWYGRCLVLCGTPAPNSAHDVVGQFHLADFGATFGSVQLPDERPAAQALAQAVLRDRGIYLRSRKDEVLPDLPSRTMREVRVELEPVQRRAYQFAVRELVADLRETDDVAFRRRLGSFMARRAALLQICSHPAGVLDGYQEVPAKQRALDRLLTELTAAGEKVVLWSFYRASLAALVARYGELGVVRFDGSVADVAERREAVRRFQEDPACRLFVGNPAAAGAGLTLHSARYAVYESVSNQAAHYLQSLDRIHRRGQERPVEYIVLLADGTLEEDEWLRLRDKERSARELLGDPGDPPPTRQAMLEELLPSARRTRTLHDLGAG